MTIAIIGATGQLGGLTIDALLERGIPATDLLALGRNTERLAALSERGLRTAAVDLNDVDGTTAILTGVDHLLLISVGAPGHALGPRGHVRAVPAPGPLAVRQRVRHIAGGRVDEECDVWDSTGRLVATGHQLAGLRIPDGQAPATRR